MKNAALLIVVFIAAAAAFWQLRPLRLAGGDSEEMAHHVVSEWWEYYYRAPATLFAHQLAWRGLRRFGWSAGEAMGLNSCLAGGLFVVALLLISRHPLFLLVNLGCGASLLFAGHEENYGYVNALLALFMACGRRVWELEGGTGVPPVSAQPATAARQAGRLSHFSWAAGGVFALACAAHLLTVFYLPALAMLGAGLCRAGGRWRWSKPLTTRDALPFAAPFAVFLVAASAGTLLAFLLPRYLYLWGLDNNVVRLVPLSATGDARYFFTLFSWEHLKFLGYVHVVSAPVAWPLIGVLIWRHGRGLLARDAFAQWLLAMTLCGEAWTFLWHPDRHYGDWDLFSNVAFPLNALAGWLLISALKKNRRDLER